MYAIYGNIYHQYTPNVSIYPSTMDPMGTLKNQKKTGKRNQQSLSCLEGFHVIPGFQSHGGHVKEIPGFNR